MSIFVDRGLARDLALPLVGGRTIIIAPRVRREEHFTTRAGARAAVAAWIDDYNQDRRHSSIGMRTPIAYELGA